ncbi:unnamed protein product [Heterobilharzia americana]|nr:unnamed protein product [Heterobilharzia americana]
MELREPESNHFDSNIKIPMDYDNISSNIDKHNLTNNYLSHHEPVLDLSLTPNSNEHFLRYCIPNPNLSYGASNYATMCPNISDTHKMNHWLIEQTSIPTSSKYSSHCMGSSSIKNSGNYIPNIPTPEQLLTRNQESLYNLHGQINFLNLFRQTWHFYQQCLAESNYLVQSTYLPTDDYQYFVNNSLSTLALSQLSNASLSSQNDVDLQDRNKISPSFFLETETNSVLNPINNQRNGMLTENHSNKNISNDKTTKTSRSDSISPVDKPRHYRKARAYFHPKQMSCLESFFQKNPYLSTRDREYLSKKLNLSEDRIRTWFQNRRMREKRKPGVHCDSDNSSLNSCTKVDYS